MKLKTAQSTIKETTVSFVSGGTILTTAPLKKIASLFVVNIIKLNMPRAELCFGHFLATNTWVLSHQEHCQPRNTSTPSAENFSFPSATLRKGSKRAEKLIFARSWTTLLSGFHCGKVSNHQSINELLGVNILDSYVSLREWHLELQAVCQSREKNIIAHGRCRGEEQASAKAAQTVIPGTEQSQEAEQMTTAAKQSWHWRWEGKKRVFWMLLMHLK